VAVVTPWPWGAWWSWILPHGEWTRLLMSRRRRRCTKAGVGEAVRGWAPTGGLAAGAHGLEASAAGEVGAQQPPPDDLDPYRGDASSEEAERRLVPRPASRRSEHPPSRRLEEEGKPYRRRRRDESVRPTGDEDVHVTARLLARRRRAEGEEMEMCKKNHDTRDPQTLEINAVAQLLDD
jgi:hypothetical protein